MAEMGVANVIAKSSYILAIDPDQCTGCEECLPYCQFNALTMEGDVMTVSELKCVGCGVCVAHCDALAMELVLREEVVEPPVTEMEWLAARAENRGQDLDTVL
jgi:heterodisulfide reductase subunit A-like polyferredoxin